MDPCLELKQAFWKILVDPTLCRREDHEVQTPRPLAIFTNSLTWKKAVLEKMTGLLLMYQGAYYLSSPLAL